MSATEALTKSELKPVVFQSKEALAVVNAASFSSSLGSIVVSKNKIKFLLRNKNNKVKFQPRINFILPHLFFF